MGSQDRTVSIKRHFSLARFVAGNVSLQAMRAAASQRRRWLLGSFAIVLLLGVNIAFLAKMVYRAEQYRQALQRMTGVLEIKPRLQGIITELNFVINGYDVSRGKKVGFADGKQYEYLSAILTNLYESGKSISDKDARAQFEMITRTVNTFAKSLDTLKSKFVLRDFDAKVVSVFFSDSSQTSLFANSYVDQMKQIAERMKKSTDLINANIESYVELELAALDREERALRKDQFRWIAADAAVLVFVLLTGVYVFVDALRQQGKR